MPPTFFFPYGDTTRQKKHVADLYKEGQPGDYLTDVLTDRAVKYIENYSEENPFFLYLSHFAVHDSPLGIEAKEKDIEKFVGKSEDISTDERTEFILEGNPDDTASFSYEERKMMAGQKDYQGFKGVWGDRFPNRMVKVRQVQSDSAYAGMVYNLDKNIGRVVDALKAKGLYENTIIVFYSDNGGHASYNEYGTSNYPARAGKGWLYDGGVRVPLIIAGPGTLLEKGSVSGQLVTSPDLYPTILNLVGLQVPKKQEVEGMDFSAQLRGEEPTKERAVFWHFPSYSNHGLQSPASATRKGDYKLIYYYENMKTRP